MEDLRDMLVSDDLGDVDEYGFSAWYLTDKRKNVKTVVHLPFVHQVQGHLIADMIVGGLFLRTLVHGRAEESLRSSFLQEDGTLRVRTMGLRTAMRRIGFRV